MADEVKKPAAKKSPAKKRAAKKLPTEKRTARKKKDRSQVDLLPELFESPERAPVSDEMSQFPAVAESEVSVPESATKNEEENVLEGGPLAQGGVQTSGAEESGGKIESVPTTVERSSTNSGPQGHQLARASDLVKSGRIDEALEQYLEILAENPQNLKAHNNLGVLFDELGQHDTAVEHLESALKVDKNNVEVLINLASALTKLGRFRLAGDPVRRALRLAPDNPGARLAQAILSFRRGLYEQAEVELRWICDRDPGAGEAWYYRAEALNRMGQFSEAMELMSRAAELLPDDARPYYTLGHLYDRQNRAFEAAEMYRRARDRQSP